MHRGEYYYTPRFCTVRIQKVFRSRAAAESEGYTETTHYNASEKYGILGKNIGVNQMLFAGYKK